jgi:predicted DNA-binding ribbon-helix-helix protein
MSVARHPVAVDWPILGGVSVTVDLPDEALARLRAQATRRGISLDGLIAELAEGLPVQSNATRATLAFVGAGASAAGITQRMDQLLADGFGRD